MLVKYNYMVMPAQIQFHGVWKIIILVLKKKKTKKNRRAKAKCASDQA